jgi:hypothetical protein
MKELALMACDGDSTVLRQMMDVWPGIENVTIGSGDVEGLEGWTPQCRLQSLSLLHPSSLEAAQSLLTNSSQTLRKLELRGTIKDPKVIETIIKTHGPRLKVLRLQDHARSGVSTIVLKYCRQLEELEFHHSPSITTCYVIPRTVRTIAYRTTTHITCVSLLPLINTITSSANLETLRCDEALVDHPHFSTLRHICRRRDIVLQFDDPSHLEVSSEHILFRISSLT